MACLMAGLPLFGGKLPWIHSYEQAIGKARAEHKMVYVFIDAEGCPYCARMLHHVLESKDVARNLKPYVLLRLKIHSPDAKKYFPKARFTPTSYFLNSEGKILIDFAGYTNEEFFFWDMSAAERIVEQAKKEGK